MKGVLKFVTGMLLNVVMAMTMAASVGVDAEVGAGIGAVVPMLLGGFLPVGVFAGVFTEVWTGKLVKDLRKGLEASFLAGIPDFSSKVQNEVIHLVDVAGDVDVLINNTTYPIPIQNLEEGDIPIGLDKFQTKATRVTDDELYAISYDKFGVNLERHRESIAKNKIMKAAHALAPYSGTVKTPVVPTSGETDTATNRKKMTLKDIVALKRGFDNLGVPTDGRVLVLCPDHVNDLLETDQKFKEQYYNYTSGKIANMYGFEVHTYECCPYYSKAGVKKAWNATPEATDHMASFAFYLPRIFRAEGTTSMYYSEASKSPQTQESLVNFRHYFIVLPTRQEAIGAIYSYDGTTTQLKDQTAPVSKNWAEVRREAKAEAAATPANETDDADAGEEE